MNNLDDIKNLLIIFEETIIEFEEEIKILERKIKKSIYILKNSNTYIKYNVL